MHIDEKCVELVKRFEGFRSKPYLDSVGRATIGYGSTYYSDGTRVSINDQPINKTEASKLMLHILELFSKRVAELIEVSVTTNQFSALVSFSYNVGVHNFKISTLRHELNEGKFVEAANEFPKWRKAGGVILKGLERRRAAEKALFLS